MPLGKPSPSASAHARQSWTCPCGRTVRGNGGQSSHKRACLVWARHRLQRVEYALAQIRAGVYGSRRSPVLTRGFRSQFGYDQGHLRARLGLEPVVWYHGSGSGAGPRQILIKDGGGNVTGELPHVVTHSPAGMSWGRNGSGPADTARSLLIHALGDRAACPVCAGTGKVACDPLAGEQPSPVLWDQARSAAEYAAGGLQLMTCWRWDCQGGYLRTRLPYQAFKRRYVARWGDEFLIARAEIRAWLTGQLG